MQKKETPAEEEPQRAADATSRPSEPFQHGSAALVHERLSYLIDCLRRREETANSIARTTRRLRHVVVGLAIFFLAIYFAAPKFSINFSALGINQEITLVQLSAVAPLAIAYLVISVSILGANRVRFIHECHIIALEIERLGISTNYSLMRKYREKTHIDEGKIGDVMAVKIMSAVSTTRDIFVGFSLALVVAASVVVASKVYVEIIAAHPHIGIVLYCYLGIAVLCALMAALFYRYSKSRKDAVLKKFISEEVTSWNRRQT